jgi:hypothetical protein
MAAGDPGTRKRNYSAVAVETKLANSISAASQGDTTTNVIVNSVSGFPSTLPYTLILDPDTSKEEVVTVTAATSTTLTITRGQDNTQAQAHSANASVRHGVSAREFRELQTHIAARGVDADSAILSGVDSHVHGLVANDGSVVGSTQQVTLTRKTLTTPTINGATLTGTVTSSANITVSGGTITGLSSAGMSDTSATPKNYVDNILGSATAAAVSAASAVVSATSSANSATLSASSATASASSATASATSAGASATSATASAASATLSATSATASASSASASATSASAAASSASAAAASVAAIATYATNASNSATSSANSATASASSATLSATSATASATSATASASSASASATSAGQAATSATSSANSATLSATSATASATSASASATSAAAAATSASSAATSAAAAATSASDAATTYDNFDDRYLGSKSSAPTVDNDGNTLLVGAIYWNSTLNAMYVWSGSTWVQIATTTIYTAPTIGSQTIASGTTYTTIAGLTLSGGLAAADPSTALGIATKQYVDSVATAINFHAPVIAATTTNLGVTYSNGSSGVGATLTADSNRAFNTLDGASVSVGGRVLIKNQTTQLQNGVYTLTNNGSGSTPWVLTRATDMDNNPAGEMANGDIVDVLTGTVNAGSAFVNSTSGTITIGTTAITWAAYYTGLPAQTGNAGKYLTTDGTTPSWALLDTQAIEVATLMGAYI